MGPRIPGNRGAGARLHRLVLSLTVAAVLLPAPVAAQADSVSPEDRWEAGGALTVVPVHEGDATVGPISNWGLTLHGALRPFEGVAVEAFVTHTPRDRDPYNRAPRIDYYGTALRLSPVVTDLFDIYVTGGLAGVTVAEEEVTCRIEAGCFAEGGPSLSDGTTLSHVLGLGITLHPEAAPVFLRIDARDYDMRDADRVYGFGVGMTW